MPLIEELAPEAGSLLGFILGQPIGDAKAHLPLDWLPWRVGDHTMGERARWKAEPPFELSILLQGHESPLQAVEIHVEVERSLKAELDALEKDVKKRLRRRLGSFSKDKLRDARPHWIEQATPPVLWMTLRWMQFETAGMQVIMRLA